MNAKKLFALLLALCLALAAVPGLAAPTRDIKALEVTVDEKLTALAELAVNAAILQETPAQPGAARIIPALEKGETPSDLLVSCALAWGIQAGILPYDLVAVDQEILALDAARAQELYEGIFTSPAYAFRQWTEEEAETLKNENSRTWYTGKELNTAFAPLCHYGVYIYSAESDGTDVDVQCDVFTAKMTEVQQSAEELPEEALVWQCNACISLRSAPEKPFGYTVNGISISPFYEAGDLSQWKAFENEKMEYSVNLPGILGVSDETASYRVWKTGDGQATLTISTVDEQTFLEAAAATYQTAYPQAKIIQEPEFDRFSVMQEGSYTLVTTSEEMQRLVMVTFTFPAERQAEYAFYAEIIRNSLSLWGISNG